MSTFELGRRVPMFCVSCEKIGRWKKADEILKWNQFFPTFCWFLSFLSWTKGRNRREEMPKLFTCMMRYVIWIQWAQIEATKNFNSNSLKWKEEENFYLPWVEIWLNRMRIWKEEKNVNFSLLPVLLELSSFC